MTHRKIATNRMRLPETVFAYAPVSSRQGMMKTGPDEKDPDKLLNDSDELIEDDKGFNIDVETLRKRIRNELRLLAKKTLF
jgi:hypothetical protein